MFSLGASKCCLPSELPIIKQSLSELVSRQKAGRSLEDSEPVPLIERKQGHWPGILNHSNWNIFLRIHIYIRFTIVR